MRKIIISFLFVAVAMTVGAASPVKQWGQLQVKGAQLCSQDGTPVTLRGVSLGWHNLWPRFYNEGAVAWLSGEWHATVIRAAMGIQIEDNYLENPEFALSCMEPVIQAAIDNGVYVIIDWHAHTMHTSEAKDFFGKMAKKYGSYPNVIYELYNEPIEDSWESLKVYAAEIIDEIRKHDPDNVILMGCPHWDQDIDLVSASPLQNVHNVMYTVHFYAATHKDYLREKTRKAVEGGLPVFISECAGMECTGDGPLDNAEWEKWVSLMEQYGISYVCWSLSDKNETCSMLLPRASKDGNWTGPLVKPWGNMVRETLLKYNK